MFTFRKEGDEFPHKGLYIYHPTDISSIGFIIKAWTHAYWFRYSKITSKFHFERKSIPNA